MSFLYYMFFFSFFAFLFTVVKCSGLYFNLLNVKKIYMRIENWGLHKVKKLTGHVNAQLIILSLHLRLFIFILYSSFLTLFESYDRDENLNYWNCKNWHLSVRSVGENKWEISARSVSSILSLRISRIWNQIYHGLKENPKFSLSINSQPAIIKFGAILFYLKPQFGAIHDLIYILYFWIILFQLV